MGHRLDLQALAENPYPILNALREREPISWIEPLQMWYVTRREDVLKILLDSENFVTDSNHSLIKRTFGSQMLSAEGDLHRRYKVPCIKTFSTDWVQTHFRGLVEQRVSKLIEHLRSNSTADLRAEFAGPLATYVICKILGFPDGSQDEIFGWYEDFAKALSNFEGVEGYQEQAQSSAKKFSDLAVGLLQEFKTAPNASLLSALATDESQELSFDEITSNALIILFGGIETTDAFIANALWVLLNHPDQLQEIRDDWRLLPNALEEVMRWEPAVQSCTRHVARDVEFEGVAFKAGDVVQCMIGAANRDSSHFENPDKFDIHRANASDHLSFAYGPHFCLGASLARFEAEVGIQKLLEAFPNLRIDDKKPSAPHGYEFRKPLQLWCEW